MISTTITYYILSDLLIHGHKVNIIEHIPPTPPGREQGEEGWGQMNGSPPPANGEIFWRKTGGKSYD